MKKRLFLLSIIALSFTLGGAQAQDKMKLRIGVEGAYPPFSWVDNSGNLLGFDIEIANALCESMNAECTLIQQDWDGIIPALLARKYDAIIASMSITEERKQKVDFTSKYYSTPAKFIAKKGADIEISAEGLADKTIGVQRATTHDSYISDNYGDGVEIKRYATQDEVYLDLQAGRIDLALQDSVAGQEGFLKTDAGQDFEFIGPGLNDPKWFGEGAGIAVRKGEDELRETLNNAIDAIRASGVYKTIQDKYFDFDVYGT